MQNPIATLFNYSETDLTLMKCIQHSQPRHWRSVGLGVIATVFMSLVPALTAAIILSLASLDFEWKGFVVNGEVAIFCVGLLATSILLTAKELKSPFAHRQLFSLLGIGGVILAMASYAGLCVAGAQSAATATAAKPLSSDEALSLGLGLSLALYIYTIFFSAVVAFVDEVRSDLDETLVREAREALGSSTALQEQFHNLSQEDIDD